MNGITEVFQKKGIKRFIIFALIVFILFMMRSMINLILLTFIFSYLMNRLVEFAVRRVPLNRRLLVLLMYTLIVGLLTFGLVKYLPIITIEISELIKRITAFYTQPHDNVLINYIETVISNNQIAAYLENGLSFLLKSFTDISKTSIQVLIALILSLFFLLEKPRLQEFTNKFKSSKIAPFYYEIEFFGRKFTRTFGKVIEAQFIIAIINCVLTVVALMIMGFPQIFGLAIMIFFLGLIPVAGVIISLIPLCLIAYTIGGAVKVIYVIIAIMIIHAVEAYILNPKLMSSKTDLPVFYTFVVLIFSQNYFGVWGLIIGIPVFVFLLDVLDVTNKEIAKPLT
ncbi:AI-2E family transporter [Lederbergia lenta]|uniref:Putative integral inner membrane protein n=1 Tax=Lederbergia lenta TaxID=1467 RepID=A0A2X4VYR9_LEDLE|nr:AI-2E family transporter [Lederbergia lenta]MCM3111217.1 AI-2E family transporter [Lederbergia lenta]MEC2325395.1 AI-2E family transporter [Lederbergia lenta]SQI55539.1 putative integral inner membrane protein [Lederbergia lenta]